ncbi:MAG: relaxase [Pseudomonadota bacterium]
MIAFGSQRAGGADLATHLANAEDNEYVEIHMHGFLADDVHGAFAEAEAQAHAMTKLEKYLYSLSINPDPHQPWTEEMYADYITRAGAHLGLIDQPHVTAKHIKEGSDGQLREHMHVVWSRVDVQNSCGINIPYDRLKLMAVAREFAQDHNLTLPDGYYRIHENHEQTSLYEKVKENETGISKAQHKETVTDLWRTSDSPKAFVAALEDHGYMLATGNRPYVLVDSFGKMHALPRMIDDRDVRSKDVERFLSQAFPPESLSTVEEARAVAAQLEESRKQIALSQKLKEQQEILERDQQKRREQMQADILAKQDLHRSEAKRLSNMHGDKIYAHDLRNAQEKLEVDFRRAANSPTGLAAFLSRITGMDAVRRKIHSYQDRKREALQEQARLLIESQNRIERQAQQHKHQLEMIEIRRREAEQAKSFEREQRSIEMAQQREKAVHYSKGYDHMPSVQLALTPPGRSAVPAKATRRFYAPTVKEANSKGRKSREQESGDDNRKTRVPGDQNLKPVPLSAYGNDPESYIDGLNSPENQTVSSEKLSEAWPTPENENDPDKGRGR